jgi:hypothetical protein
MALPLAPSPLASPPAPMLPRRRRGGQPGNRNAFCHGMVSARDPSSLAVISALSMLLIKCSYHEHGIPCDADSFRGKINKSDLKSPHPSGFFYPSWRNPLARTPRIASGRSSNPSSPLREKIIRRRPPSRRASGSARPGRRTLQPYSFLLRSSGTNTSHLNKVIQVQKWI